MTVAPTRAPALAAARYRLPWLCAAVAFAVVAGGLYLRRATETVLGAPYPPSLGNLDPAADPLLTVSLLCFAAAVVLGPRLLDARLTPAAVAAALLCGTLVLRLALAAGRGGTGAWDRVFDGFTKAETERIWLFFAPFVCLAAARGLGGARPSAVGLVLAALAAQALVHELLFDTVW